jgi:transposase
VRIVSIVWPLGPLEWTQRWTAQPKTTQRQTTCRKVKKSLTSLTHSTQALLHWRVGSLDPTCRALSAVVLTMGNAPWHRGKVIDEAMKDNPHLEFYRLPSYSPKLNVIERSWKKLRRRATHNRLFDTIADLKRSIRNSLCYFQTVRQGSSP